MVVLRIQRGFAVCALLVVAAFSFASDTKDGTDSLFLSSGKFTSSVRQPAETPQLQVQSDEYTKQVEYTVSNGKDVDLRDVTPNAGNCGILLGIAAVVSLAILLRDRLFPYYR